MQTRRDKERIQTETETLHTMLRSPITIAPNTTTTQAHNMISVITRVPQTILRTNQPSTITTIAVSSSPRT